MKAIIIDDEPWMLKHFCDVCSEIGDIELVGVYRNPLKAIEEALNLEIEIAFVDMEMPQITGNETAKKLLEINPNIKVIIVSAYDEVYIRTMNGCNEYGYLRKPYTKEDLTKAIEM